MSIEPNSKLAVICFTPEMHQNSNNYWYAVKRSGQSLTAFHSRQAFEEYLDVHGLSLKQPLPEERGTHAMIGIEGEYRVAATSFEELCAIKADDYHLAIENGDFVAAKVTHDADGLRTSHYYHAGVVGMRYHFDYLSTQAAMNCGMYRMTEAEYMVWEDGQRAQNAALEEEGRSAPSFGM